MATTELEARTHFKVGSRKSKLAMVQSEYIVARLKEVFPEYTFEIVNFDTKGDQILNVALPKIGDKGLFTKELEDALEQGSIDFVVHSLKDMPCQTLPDNLIISGVPEREDPRDALVMAERWRATKSTLDDLDDESVIGTSSLRRISQLKLKYPTFKFETIRGNLQTRFAKLDASDHKFDAIILATAGLKRMGYEDRISQILPPEICMHAVSQGALGIESRRDDLLVMKMINSLNDEETLLRCIAERTLLTKLEGGCSAPIGVVSKVTEQGIWLEGAVFDLDGTRCIKDKFELGFNAHNLDCPVLSTRRSSVPEDVKNETTGGKRSVDETEENNVESMTKKQRQELAKSDSQVSLKDKRHFSFIVDLNIDENKMSKAELCGLHLAERLKEKGADLLIEEVKAIVHKKD